MNIGRIAVPSPVASGLTFPLVSDYGYGTVRPWPVIVHRFGVLATKAEQRFQVGMGPRKFAFKRAQLSLTDVQNLWAFYESVQGSFQSFIYNAPQPDGTTVPYTVIFETQPLSIDMLANSAKTGLNFVECPDPSTAPDYPVNSTCLRFPSTALATALTSQVQQIIPLIHIRVREAAVPDIWLSDRLVTLADASGGTVQSTMGWAAASQTYLPRVLNLGEQGSDAILTQDLKGSADSVTFTFGNADRSMSALANDTDLMYASIDLCLYHVQSGILLQLWKGFVMSFAQPKGQPKFTMQCSDGFYQVMQQYPVNVASRTCWKTYNDGLNCPWAAKSGMVQITGLSTAGVEFAGDPTQCDFYYDSANGCEAHNMTPYFGGQPTEIQSVNQPDSSTGFIGLFRNAVTATSIVSDSWWGYALPEIWCNQGTAPGSALYAFMANALVVTVRSDNLYLQALAVLGVGPLGAYTIDSPPEFVQLGTPEGTPYVSLGPAYGGVFATNADGFVYLVAPMLDGFQAYGSSNSLGANSGQGLRQILGTDPVSPLYGVDGSYADLSFGLSLAPGPDGAPVNPGPFYAAGIAFVELTIPAPAGFNPSTPYSHTVTVPIAQGLSGWTWDQYGNRTLTGGLINPFWIAVNSLLRASGLNQASAAAQQAMFVLPSLIVGDGSGTAEIADDMVVPILGSGLELQFQFQGTLGQQKPFRDWLTEILSCALGFYLFEFGALKLGCRINASATSAFTLGNMIYNSLQLEPIAAAFEHLTIDFADQAYLYQANTADYQDKTHAAYYGRAGAPLSARQHVVGCATLNQALRIAAVRVREEVGGINATEWRCARTGTWKTTILGLDTEVGQVASITDAVEIPGPRGTCNVAGNVVTWVSGDPLGNTALPATSPDNLWWINKEILINGEQVQIESLGQTSEGIGVLFVSSPPGNGNGIPFKVITADFRIEKWRLLKDWSIEIQGKTVTGSMYDLLAGPQPTDVPPATLPALFYPIPLGVWLPWQVQAASDDALFPDAWTFDVDQSYTPLKDGTAQANVIATGKLPVNDFSPGVGSPSIGTIAQSTTGGSIPGGVTVRVTVCAMDTNGLATPPAAIALVVVPAGTNTNSITLGEIVWPRIGNLASYNVFASTSDSDIGQIAPAAGTLTGGAGNVYTPNSITLTAIEPDAWGLPNSNVAKVRIKVKLHRHAGNTGTAVTAVNDPTLITSQELIDLSGSPVDWTGRVVSVIGRPNASTPFASFNITSWDPTTGEMGLDRDCSTGGYIMAGDAITIRNQDSSLGATAAVVMTVTDPFYENVTNGYGGLAVNAEIGNLIRVIAGTGAGQTPAKITGNTSTSVTFQPGLLMDETSIWIIETPGWAFPQDSNSIENSDPTQPTSLTIPTANFIEQPILIEGFTVDVNGNESDEGEGPIREDWIYGQVGALSGAMSLSIFGTLAIGSNLAPPAFYLTNVTLSQGVTVLVTGAPTGANLVFEIYAGSTPLFTVALGNALTVVAGQTIGSIAGTPTIPEDTAVIVNIVQVGTTFPGANATLQFS